MASSLPSDHDARVHTLFGAALREKVSRIKALAKQFDTEGIGIRRTISGMRDCLDQTALHAAAAGGNRDACDYLINDVKLDIEAKNTDGETPLFKAIQGGQFATAMHLLNMGARPNVTNNTSFSPLYYAAEKGHGELLHLLVSKGANVDALSCTGTPLQRAASRRNEEAVKILLDNQANANLFLETSGTPLWAAVLATSLQCVELLIEAGANPNAITCGESPLYLAASEGEPEIVKCLLGAGANPNMPNSVGMLPLEIAVYRGHSDVVEILFPVTLPIQTYSEWSIDAIHEHIFSDEARNEVEFKIKMSFCETKIKGDDAFMYKDYDEAILWYTAYLEKDPWEAISNRGLCWAHKQDKDRAKSDANLCIRLRPTSSISFINASMILGLLGNQKEADLLFSKAMKINAKETQLVKPDQDPWR